MIKPISLLAFASLLAQSTVQAKAVFAHYMVGGLDSFTDHAATDIDQAIALGFDAFALNVGNPGAGWATDALQQLFSYAKDKEFGLFFSFDFYAANDLSAHQDFYDDFKNESAYYKYGPDGLNVVSTFSGGDLGPSTWADFKTKNNVYLIPNPESDGDYYSNSATFFENWNAALDGVFSWETAWPYEADAPSNVTFDKDKTVKDAAADKGKAYMMGLSSIQYKHCCGDSWYRPGEVNLPERMTQILSVSPELVEVMTWNDAGESHYIGNTWKEALNEEILEYGNSETYPHDGWQPLISSFITAFKGDLGPSDMAPPGDSPIGAMWYRGVLTSCSGDVPRSSGAAIDAVNYAVVLPAGSEGFSVRVSSNGQELRTDSVQGGLNYNSVAGMTTGSQKIEVLDGSGTVVATASSKVDVVQGPVGDFCNYNYYVDGLA